MRSTRFHTGSLLTPRRSPWRARILYGLAFIGVVAVTLVSLLVYEALQVPPAKLEEVVPFPKVTSPAEKIEAIPNTAAAALANPKAKGSEPAYAHFYTTRPNEAEPDKIKNLRPRPRPKPAKRPANVAKPQKSS